MALFQLYAAFLRKKIIFSETPVAEYELTISKSLFNNLIY